MLTHERRAVDSTAAASGLPPTVDVRLYDCPFINNKENRKTSDLCDVGTENHSIERINCPSGRYCATFLLLVPSVTCTDVCQRCTEK